MDKICGTNLGNWLVLEKWMHAGPFAGTEAEDEIWLGRHLPAEELVRRLKEHRDTYVTEQDFADIARLGINLVRIPVPYFIFDDRPPYPGCVEHLDKAFEWAQKHGIKIMIDLHTCPGSQNGYDNGGITGVCKWCKNPEEVDFVLTVLERLGKRYGSHEALYGIGVLNEPISWLVYITAPSTGKAVDKEEAKGSGHVPMSFLRSFYKRAYRVLRDAMGEEKTIVFHDGFRLWAWGNFFQKAGMKNVVLDTHIYIFAMESFVPIHRPWVYKLFIGCQKLLIKQVQKHIPVVVGEWCICNKYADAAKDEQERRRRFRQVAKLELDAWDAACGHIYWNYRLLPDVSMPPHMLWKESWDLSRCLAKDWISFEKGQLNDA